MKKHLKNKKVLLVNADKKRFINSFTRSAIKHHVDCEVIHTQKDSIICVDQYQCDVFCAGKKIDFNSYAYVFLRHKYTDPHVISLLSYMLDFLKIPFNDKGNLDFTSSHSKITQMVKIGMSKLAIPKTVILSRDSFLKYPSLVKSHIKFPCIVKFGGRRGRGVKKIDSYENVVEFLPKNKRKLFALQEFIPHDFYIRTLVFGGEIIGSVREDYFIHWPGGNPPTETKSPLIEISAEEKKLCLGACRVLGLDFSGVDFIRTKRGPILVEANKSPQIKRFQKNTKIDVADFILKNLASL